MKGKLKLVYLLEGAIALLLPRFAFATTELTTTGRTWALSIGLAVFIAIAMALLGLKRPHKNFLLKSTIRTIAIVMMSTGVIIYTLGIFLGFNRSYFSTNPHNIFVVFLPIVLVVLFEEILRHSLTYKITEKKLPAIIFALLMSIAHIIIVFNPYTLSGAEDWFVFVCVLALPIIAREALAAYLCYHFGALPGFIFKIVIATYLYILPIAPNLGNYIFAVIGVLIPFIIFKLISKTISCYNEDVDLTRRTSSRIFTIPVVITLIVLTALVSGIFKYQLIAVMPNSMSPIYGRGDAVLLEKVPADDIKVGDVLVFWHDRIIVTHRVIVIKQQGEHRLFRTKGDANPKPDTSLVKESEVVGKVQLISKFIGYPTVWLNDLFKGVK